MPSFFEGLNTKSLLQCTFEEQRYSLCNQKCLYHYTGLQTWWDREEKEEKYLDYTSDNVTQLFLL